MISLVLQKKANNNTIKLQEKQENNKIDKKSIRIIPFWGKKQNLHMWSGKFMGREGIKGYDIFLTGDAEMLEDNAD